MIAEEKCDCTYLYSFLFNPLKTCIGLFATAAVHHRDNGYVNVVSKSRIQKKRHRYKTYVLLIFMVINLVLFLLLFLLQYSIKLVNKRNGVVP